MQVTLTEGQYSLTAELVRFMVPPGEDSLLHTLPKPLEANGHRYVSKPQPQKVSTWQPCYQSVSLNSSKPELGIECDASYPNCCSGGCNLWKGLLV